jgi:hypothetical protein
MEKGGGVKQTNLIFWCKGRHTVHVYTRTREEGEQKTTEFPQGFGFPSEAVRHEREISNARR